MTVVVEYQANPDQPLLLPMDLLAAMSTDQTLDLNVDKCHEASLQCGVGVYDTRSSSSAANGPSASVCLSPTLIIVA